MKLLSMVLFGLVSAFSNNVYAGDSQNDFPGGFLCETMVQTANGWECLGEIPTGSSVIAFNEDDFTPSSQKIVNNLTRNVHSIYSLKVSNTDAAQFLAGNQLVLVDTEEDYEWVRVKDLSIGSRIVVADGGAVVVKELRRIKGDFVVKHIELEDVHTFAVGPKRIIVHNPKWKVPTGKKDLEKIGKETAKVGKVGYGAFVGAGFGMEVGGPPGAIVGAVVGGAVAAQDTANKERK